MRVALSRLLLPPPARSGAPSSGAARQRERQRHPGEPPRRSAIAEPGSTTPGAAKRSSQDAFPAISVSTGCYW
ncbi:MAG: hypothetical protein J3K34DRAFT_432561 [Monoraphidium minutum]|nr:MAG: hypothetical protein J3K34DRAFT_432561 [Monoraphidium minutum]